MHFFQRCCVFFALTEILVIIINLASTIRDLILDFPDFSKDPWDGYFWKLFIPLVILTIIICLVAAIYLCDGAVNKNEKHFLPWLIVHGFFASLASIASCVALFYPAVSSSLFRSFAILASILWARWIIATKCRNIIKNEALESPNKEELLSPNKEELESPKKLESNLYYKCENIC